jgi:VanZ family protein
MGGVIRAAIIPWRRWAYALAVAGMIVAASSRSRVEGPEISHFDKIAHFSVYGLLGTLVLRARGKRAAWQAVALVSLFGLSDELHQHFTPGRSMDGMDWVADTVGAALAVTLYRQWSWYREMLEMPLGGHKPGREVAAELPTAETV